jgi:hypothetical protein
MIVSNQQPKCSHVTPSGSNPIEQLGELGRKTRVLESENLGGWVATLLAELSRTCLSLSFCTTKLDYDQMASSVKNEIIAGTRCG